MLHGVPLSPLRTDRLVIRETSGADELGLLKALLDHPLVAPSLWVPCETGSRPGGGGARVAGQWLAAWRLRAAPSQVLPTDAGALAGALYLDANTVAYCVAPGLWGKGYASEMLSAVCGSQALMRGRDALRAAVLRGNHASVKVLEKSGFRFAGLCTWGRAHGGHAAMLAYRRGFT